MQTTLTFAALAMGVSAIGLERKFKVQTRPENACDDCMCGKVVQCSNNKCPDGKTFRDAKCKCPPEFDNMVCTKDLCWDGSARDEYCMCPTKPTDDKKPEFKDLADMVSSLFPDEVDPELPDLPRANPLEGEEPVIPGAPNREIRPICRIPLTEEDTTVTANFSVRGGSSGKVWAKNLLTDGEEPWNKWYEDESEVADIKVDFDTAAREVVAVAFKSANDEPERDPETVLVAANDKEVGAFDLAFGARWELSEQFFLTEPVTTETILFEFENIDLDDLTEIQLGQIQLFEYCSEEQVAELARLAEEAELARLAAEKAEAARIAAEKAEDERIAKEKADKKAADKKRRDKKKEDDKWYFGKNSWFK